MPQPTYKILPLLLLCVAIPARADSLRLPLNGYYHPGRYMPIQWDITTTGQVQISATNAVTTTIPSAPPSGIAPFLSYAPINTAHYQTPGGAFTFHPAVFHPLSTSEKIIALCVEDDSLAKNIFPGDSIIPIHLDPLTPLPGPPIAWQSLDAILMSPHTLSRISPDSRRQLYAAGITFAVTGDTQPDQIFSWTHSANLWITHPIAPVSIINDSAYAPTYGWSPGRSISFRSTTLIIGLLITILAAGLSLWRSRWMPINQIILATITILIATVWYRSQSPITTITGNVYLTNLSPEIRDHWTYQTTPRATEFRAPITEITTPIFYNISQANQTNLELMCDPTGTPTTLTGQFPANTTLAILTRACNDTTPSPLQSPIRTPLRMLLVPSIYPEFKLAGEAAADDSTQWGGLVLKRD